MLRTVHLGLGPIGLQILRATVDDGISEVAAAGDVNPEIVGTPLSDVAGRRSLADQRVSDGLGATIEAAGPADILVLATGSKIPDIKGQIIAAVEAGLNVVSTSEELNWPWLRHPALSEEIARAAEANGVTVVGTGINPGFLLDLLPLALCRPSLGVRKVVAKRIVDVSLRREQLQAKIGSGLDEDSYRQLAAKERVGHVGLAESAAMIAGGMGWEFDGFDETCEPVIATEPCGTEFFDIQPGQVMGSHQEVHIFAKGGKEVELICRMTHGEPDPRDEVIIEGDPPVHMRIDGGIFGDTATAGCTVNIFSQVAAARPGLLSVKDLPVA